MIKKFKVEMERDIPKEVGIFSKSLNVQVYCNWKKAHPTFGYLGPFEFVSGDKPGVIGLGEQYIYVVLSMQTT